jgi:hypothetical protein
VHVCARSIAPGICGRELGFLVLPSVQLPHLHDILLYGMSHTVHVPQEVDLGFMRLPPLEDAAGGASSSLAASLSAAGSSGGFGALGRPADLRLPVVRAVAESVTELTARLLLHVQVTHESCSGIRVKYGSIRVAAMYPLMYRMLFISNVHQEMLATANNLRALRRSCADQSAHTARCSCCPRYAHS